MSICNWEHFEKMEKHNVARLSHNYMFLKECPIPISSTSGNLKLTLTLHLYQKLNEIRKNIVTQQWSLAKKDKKSDVGLVTG